MEEEQLVDCPRCRFQGSPGCLLCNDPTDAPRAARPASIQGPTAGRVPAGLALQYQLLGYRRLQDWHEVASLRRAYFYEH